MAECPDVYATFRERFRLVNDPAMLRVERTVLGGDYGASSYTTRRQADGLAVLLGLDSSKALLDIGSGSGWPGNYLAASTGCTAVLIDPTFEGMAVAADRSRRDRLKAHGVVASGASLPFRAGVFDASTSSDVFC